MRITEQQLGPEHASTARGLDSLALLHSAMGRHAEAPALCERALQIREQLDPEHRDTAASLNNLAGLHRSMGHHTEALPLLERAVRIMHMEQIDTATGHSNLAIAALHRDGHICEKGTGSEHPNSVSPTI